MTDDNPTEPAGSENTKRSDFDLTLSVFVLLLQFGALIVNSVLLRMAAQGDLGRTEPGALLLAAGAWGALNGIWLLRSIVADIDRRSRNLSIISTLILGGLGVYLNLAAFYQLMQVI